MSKGLSMCFRITSSRRQICCAVISHKGTHPSSHFQPQPPRMLSPSNVPEPSPNVKQFKPRLPRMSRMRDVPHKVLCKMIELRMACHPIRGYYKALYRLQLVCKLWSDIILSTPSLWSVVTNTDLFPVINRALTLSREHPLVIGYSDDFSLVQPYMVPDVTARLLDHSHRWLALHVESAYKYTGAQILFSKPTPLLRFLSIMQDQHVSDIEIFTSQAPNLSQLHARYFLWARDVVPFSSVRSLEVGHDGDWPGLRNTLEALPNLENLVLQNNPNDRVKREVSVERTSSISLPNLRRLSILGIPFPAVEAIVGQVISNNLRHFALIVSIEALSLANSIPSLQEFLSVSIRNGLALPKHISIGREGVLWGSKTGQNAEDVGGVQVLTSATAETIHWIGIFMATVDQTKPLDVTVRLGLGTRMRAMNILRALAPLRHIHTLDLLDRSQPQGIGGLQEWLQWLTPRSEPGSVLILPMLSELHVWTGNNNDIMDDLFDTIRARQAYADSGSFLGKRITKVVIHSGKLSSDTLHKIQELLGPQSSIILPDGRSLFGVQDTDPVFQGASQCVNWLADPTGSKQHTAD
jgi:hypothetical protein